MINFSLGDYIEDLDGRWEITGIHNGDQITLIRPNQVGTWFTLKNKLESKIAAGTLVHIIPAKNWLKNNANHSDTDRVLMDVELTCEHEYKQYVGLTESYSYCIGCDKKQTETK